MSLVLEVLSVTDFGDLPLGVDVDSLNVFDRLLDGSLDLVLVKSIDSDFPIEKLDSRNLNSVRVQLVLGLQRSFDSHLHVLFGFHRLLLLDSEEIES